LATFVQSGAGSSNGQTRRRNPIDNRDHQHEKAKEKDFDRGKQKKHSRGEMEKGKTAGHSAKTVPVWRTKKKVLKVRLWARGGHGAQQIESGEEGKRSSVHTRSERSGGGGK